MRIFVVFLLFFSLSFRVSGLNQYMTPEPEPEKSKAEEIDIKYIPSYICADENCYFIAGNDSKILAIPQSNHKNISKFSFPDENNKENPLRLESFERDDIWLAFSLLYSDDNKVANCISKKNIIDTERLKSVFTIIDFFKIETARTLQVSSYLISNFLDDYEQTIANWNMIKSTGNAPKRLLKYGAKLLFNFVKKDVKKFARERYVSPFIEDLHSSQITSLAKVDKFLFDDTNSRKIPAKLKLKHLIFVEESLYIVNQKNEVYEFLDSGSDALIKTNHSFDYSGDHISVVGNEVYINDSLTIKLNKELGSTGAKGFSHSVNKMEYGRWERIDSYQIYDENTILVVVTSNYWDGYAECCRWKNSRLNVLSETEKTIGLNSKSNTINVEYDNSDESSNNRVVKCYSWESRCFLDCESLKLDKKEECVKVYGNTKIKQVKDGFIRVYSVNEKLLGATWRGFSAQVFKKGENIVIAQDDIFRVFPLIDYDEYYGDMWNKLPFDLKIKLSILLLKKSSLAPTEIKKLLDGFFADAFPYQTLENDTVEGDITKKHHQKMQETGNNPTRDNVAPSSSGCCILQ